MGGGGGDSHFIHTFLNVSPFQICVTVNDHMEQRNNGNRLSMTLSTE